MSARRLRAEDLSATSVVPTLDAPIERGRSLVYCATFALAWHQLGVVTGATPARLQPPGPLDEALARAPVPAGTLDDATALTAAGEGPSFLASLRRDLEARFGAADFGLPERLASDTLLAYAWLSKDLAFATPFELDPRGLRVGDARMTAFGVRPATDRAFFEALSPQVVVHGWEAPVDFVVELRSKAPDDVLLVARVPGATDLRAASAGVLARAARAPSLWRRLGGAHALAAHDTLLVPVIEGEIERTFRELEGKRVVASGDLLAGAVQVVKVRLDERGARLESSAKVEVLRGPPRGRAMICELPFLFLLARRGAAEPYFAAWIDSAELLRPFSEA